MTSRPERLTPTADGQMLAPPRQPPMSLLYLMAMVAAFGIMLALSDTAPDIPEATDTDKSWGLAIRLSNILVRAVCLTGLFIVIKEWMTTKRFAPHPGYLLLIYFALSNLVTAAAAYWIATSITEYQHNVASGEQVTRDQVATITATIKTLRTIAIAATTVFCSLLLVGLFRDRWWWRWQFLLFTLSVAANMVFMTFVLNIGMEWTADWEAASIGMLGSAVQWIKLIAVAGFAICIMLDWRSRTRRDWVHWLGLFAAFLTLVVANLVTLLASRYASPSVL